MKYMLCNVQFSYKVNTSSTSYLQVFVKFKMAKIVSLIVSVDAEDKVCVSIKPIVSVDGPKRKPFLNRKQTVNTDAGEWIVKDVEGKKVLVDAYPKSVVEKVVESVEVPKVQGGPKRKPFLNRKQTVNNDAGQWDVKVVDGKRVFVQV